ncbi:capsular exopolysaccharide synthesis family protein [Primorskyibacter sedentarius]|uniref:non-specific protein-tyrosine kinase n=1 Tax=Primorskyibacter sedentarius TaxID=745311 RepID=A0A4R3JDC9_9RHOB|nr:polysaccharide biosynthesis tyrosine autokinase [Primorskyibacter sedentarius]TCS62710.1 capsular exopolysaccharide synthesis family protein [Primorskyibacter sedentarius]
MNLHNTPLRQQSISEDGTRQLAELTGILWRGRFVLLASTLIALVLGAAYIFYVATPVYKSTATLVLETRQEQVVDLQGVISGLSPDSSTVTTEVEVLRSRGLATKVVEALKLIDDPEFNVTLRPESVKDKLLAMARSVVPNPNAIDAPQATEAQAKATVVDELLQRQSVQNVSNSLVFHVSVLSKSAEKAALIANTFADAYISDQLQVKNDAALQATDWLTERVGELQIELEKSETAVRAFRTETDLINADALALLDRQQKEVRARLEAARAELENKRAYDARLSGASDREVAELTQNAALLRILSESDEQLTAEQKTAFDMIAQRLRDQSARDLQQTAQQIATLDSTAKALQQRVDAQSADLIVLDQLVREAQASRLLYEYFLNRMKETSAQQGIQQADSRVLSQAVAPTNAALPRVSLVIAATGLAGFLIGAAFCISRAMAVAGGFHSSSQMEAVTGKAVFGEVPRIRARKRSRFFTYIREHPTSAIAEAFRNLRTSVFMSKSDARPRVILVSSALSGEGKSATCLALAHQMSELGSKILLVDADTRRGGLASYLGVSQPEHSLTEALRDDLGWRQAVIPAAAPNLDFVHGGTGLANIPDYFAKQWFPAFIDEALKQYDTIVIDTPPVLLVTDARILAKVADVILFVVRWNSTSQQQVQDGIKKFESLGYPVSGLVMSMLDARGMRRYGYDNSYGPTTGRAASYFNN